MQYKILELGQFSQYFYATSTSPAEPVLFPDGQLSLSSPCHPDQVVWSPPSKSDEFWRFPFRYNAAVACK
jgi:hypothetical protein